MTISKHVGRHRKMSGLALSILATLCAGGFGSEAGAVNVTAGSMFRPVATATAMRQGDSVLGTLAATQSVHIEVALKLRNRDQLDNFNHAVMVPNAVMAKRTLTAEEIAANHLPTENDAQRVVNFLNGAGFSNVEVAPNRMLVSADAPAGVVQSAFNTQLVQVLTRDGRDAFANTSAVQIPLELDDVVLSVIGLQDVHQAHTMLRYAVNPLAISGHNPTEFSSIYGGSGVPTAAGVTVGIITQGKLTNVISDLNSFTANNGLATVTTQTVQTGSTSTDTSGDGEWDLDSQDIVGMGGGQVGKIIFYNIPTLSNTNLTADINTVSLGQRGEDHQRLARRMRNLAPRATVPPPHRIRLSRRRSRRARRSRSRRATPALTNAATGGVAELAGRFAVRHRGRGHQARTPRRRRGTAKSSGTTCQQRRDRRQSEHVRAEAELADAVERCASRRRGHRVRRRSRSSGAKVIVDGANQQIGGTSLAAPLFSGLWARMLAAKGTEPRLRRSVDLPVARVGVP